MLSGFFFVVVVGGNGARDAGACPLRSGFAPPLHGGLPETTLPALGIATGSEFWTPWSPSPPYQQEKVNAGTGVRTMGHGPWPTTTILPGGVPDGSATGLSLIPPMLDIGEITPQV